VLLFYSFRFFSDVFGSHLGVPKTKHNLPADNVTLWHVYKTSTMHPSAKHVSWEVFLKEMVTHYMC